MTSYFFFQFSFFFKAVAVEPPPYVLDDETPMDLPGLSSYLVEHKRKLPYLLGGIRYKRSPLRDYQRKRALEYLTGGIRYRRDGED
ncbi:unnamed protein product [Dibothriocephalus latus]|uniref:Uncharacterized protein n=1 Tax=Dibothriocephalus latus TaxID=60516 RepID=A0A3P7LH85_DIBLA|nr:unnamed protein product [Dibothriocephalus latus]